MNEQKRLTELKEGDKFKFNLNSDVIYTFIKCSVKENFIFNQNVLMYYTTSNTDKPFSNYFNDKKVYLV